MKIIDVEQRSLLWLQARAGIPTASEWHNLVTPKWEIRRGQMVESYLAQKVAETWTGGAISGFQTIDMELGSILEEYAIPFFEFETGQKVTQVGFVTTDDGKLGCSPDGLIGESSGIEIKCPTAIVHTKNLLRETIPDEYLAQVHGSMLVTGRSEWKFMSYRIGFPHMLITVERDDKIQAVLAEALGLFLERLEAAMAVIIEKNGGKRPERPKYVAHPEPPNNYFDIIP